MVLHPLLSVRTCPVLCNIHVPIRDCAVAAPDVAFQTVLVEDRNKTWHRNKTWRTLIALSKS